MSILTSSTTICSGLFYLTEKLDEGVKIFFFALILISNALFLGKWIKEFIYALEVFVNNKMPKLAR